MPYCIPEQPPPLTKIRSASCGLPSFERSSLRRVCASEVSETTACSITFWMLPRRQLASPPCGEVGGAEGDAGWGRSTDPSARDPFACVLGAWTYLLSPGLA